MKDIREQLSAYLDAKPVLGRNVFVASGAAVIGKVTLGDSCSVWHNAVLRADLNDIIVGRCSNVQDNCVLHVADDYPCVVGDCVTIGHGAILHACRIGNEVLIGMGATVLDGAVIGDQSLVGARALVTSGTQVPPGSLVLGTPAKVVRELTPEERSRLKSYAEKYVAIMAYCRERQNSGATTQPTTTCDTRHTTSSKHASRRKSSC